jgi:catechol 2,3-dioxygenase-like lactoylglutathione lyase family enzyme
MNILALHHVQLAMPWGGEDAARSFYGSVLGFSEVPKPEPLAKRGGVWFTSGAAEVHLGVEDDFRPARKAHPALLVDDLAGIARRCAESGVTPIRDEPLPGYDRVYVSDPFGNRIELLQRAEPDGRTGMEI